MKALVINGPQNAEFIEVEKPKATGDLVLVKVQNAGICATDFSIYSGESSFVESGLIKYPVRIGHEWSGVVEAVGEDVKNIKSGDRVISESGVSCGKCEACKKGEYDSCKSIKSVGTVNTWDGCFAEYMLMPERHLYVVPDNVTSEEAALIEPMAIAYGGFQGVEINENTTVAVIGVGAIGMASIWLARYYGAKKVISIARKDNKLQKALDIGATHIINNTKEDQVAKIMELTDGKGVDVIIETSGSDKALFSTLDIIRAGGTISLISFYEKLIDRLPIDTLVLNRITLKGVAGVFGYPKQVLDIVADNKASLDPIISHRIKFGEVIDFFENQDKYNQEKIKVMVEF